MARPCSICTHAQLSEIDCALIRSESFRNVASRFQVSTAALQRHRIQHIAAQLAAGKQETNIQSASALVKELQEITRKTRDVLTRALRGKHYELALKALGRLEKQLELKGRLLGELEDRGGRGGQTQVIVTYVDKQMNVTAAGAAAPMQISGGRQ